MDWWAPCNLPGALPGETPYAYAARRRAEGATLQEIGSAMGVTKQMVGGVTGRVGERTIAKRMARAAKRAEAAMAAATRTAELARIADQADRDAEAKRAECKARRSVAAGWGTALYAGDAERIMRALRRGHRFEGHLDDCEMRLRPWNALRRAGIETSENARHYTLRDLSKISGVGRAALLEYARLGLCREAYEDDAHPM